MTCQILTKEESAGFGCAFEEWSKENKTLCSCGKTVIAKVGSNLLCIDHLPDALIRCGVGAYLGMKTGKKSVYPQKYDFKEDFLKACKKESEQRNVCV